MILPGHDVHDASHPSLGAVRTPARRARTGAIPQFPSLLPGDPAPSPDRQRSPRARFVFGSPLWAMDCGPSAAVLTLGFRWRSRCVLDMKGTCLLTMTWVHTGGQSLSTQDVCPPPVSITLSGDPQSPNNPQGIPAMANTMHPLDSEVDDMASTRADMIRLFASDGHICPAERGILDRFDGHYHGIARYRRREVAADSFKRNGNTRLTRERFSDAGFGLTDLDAERNRRKIVTFPTRKHAG